MAASPYSKVRLAVAYGDIQTQLVLKPGQVFYPSKAGIETTLFSHEKPLFKYVRRDKGSSYFVFTPNKSGIMCEAVFDGKRTQIGTGREFVLHLNRGEAVFGSSTQLGNDKGLSVAMVHVRKPSANKTKTEGEGGAAAASSDDDDQAMKEAVREEAPPKIVFKLSLHDEFKQEVVVDYEPGQLLGRPSIVDHVPVSVAMLVSEKLFKVVSASGSTSVSLEMLSKNMVGRLYSGPDDDEGEPISGVFELKRGYSVELVGRDIDTGDFPPVYKGIFLSVYLLPLVSKRVLERSESLGHNAFVDDDETQVDEDHIRKVARFLGAGLSSAQRTGAKLAIGNLEGIKDIVPSSVHAEIDQKEALDRDDAAYEAERKKVDATHAAAQARKSQERYIAAAADGNDDEEAYGS